MVQLPWETVWRLLKRLERPYDGSTCEDTSRRIRNRVPNTCAHHCSNSVIHYSKRRKRPHASPEGRWVGLRSISRWHTARPEKAARPDTRHDMDKPQRRYAEGTKPVPKR